MQADVYQCSQCKLVFLDQESFSYPDDFYQNQYHQTYLTHIDPDMLDPEKHFSKMQKATAMWIDRVRGLLTGNEVLLDVGCSTGHLLAGVRDHTRSVYGQELNRKEIDFCQNKLGLEVSDAPLTERFEENSLDVITLIFVLEHIGNPVQFLADLHRCLKPGGKLIIVVPNVMDPLLSLYDIPQFGEFYYCIEHLFYYSPDTLKILLDRTGFDGEPIGVQEYPVSNHLNWAYRQQPSETLNARRMGPDLSLQDDEVTTEWEALWENVDGLYRKFLAGAGYYDRVWCVARKSA